MSNISWNQLFRSAPLTSWGKAKSYIIFKEPAWMKDEEKSRQTKQGLKEKKMDIYNDISYIVTDTNKDKD